MDGPYGSRHAIIVCHRQMWWLGYGAQVPRGEMSLLGTWDPNFGALIGEMSLRKRFCSVLVVFRFFGSINTHGTQHANNFSTIRRVIVGGGT